MRVGYWRPGGGRDPFIPVGLWTGPCLRDEIAGTVMDQELAEGTVRFRLGVLFTPRQPRKLERIVILEKEVPSMWGYDTWEKLEENHAETTEA